MEKQEALQRYFGHASFRAGQEEVVDAILQGRDVLGIMPTGAGKSVCYQLSALLLNGITLVISPLISLMKDQVDSLLQIGIPAAYINSSMALEAFQHVMYDARQGAYRILYVAPERLQTEGFLHFAMQADIRMVTVDEAHCVSQWGQDFRQSYLEIAGFLQKLPRRPIVSAFTATATKQVSRDICNLLQLQDPYCMTTGFDRKNLYFGVQSPSSKEKALLEILQDRRGKSGIIYCLARKTVEELCDRLCEKGFPATRYHAGLPQGERAINQEDFLFDRKSIMVATNAFGMGIDKSNVSFVVHYNMPKDLESYYQEAGRAGRDGEPADCILLYSGRDVRTNTFLIEQAREAEDLQDLQLKEQWIAKSKERLKTMTIYATMTDCLRSYMLRYFGERSPEFCGHCSNCKGSFTVKDITLEAKKIISCVYRGLQNQYHLSRTMTAEVLIGSEKDVLLRMHLDRLSTYGIMKEYTSHAVMRMIDALLDMDILTLQTYKDYQTLQLTPAAAEVIRGQRKVEWKIRKEEKRARIAIAENASSGVEDALFERLSKLRTKLADEENVPAYIVFSNASLRDMCRRKPKNMAEFRQIAGVGVIKSQKYGMLFMKEIAAYCAEQV